MTHLQSARKQQWGNLSDPAREQFYWHPPGEYSGESTVPAGGRNDEGKVMGGARFIPTYAIIPFSSQILAFD